MRRNRRRFSEHRRRLLQLHVAEHLDGRLEARSTVTPIGTAGLGLTAIVGSMHASGGG
ncbi:MAG: hypothetical protein ACYC61_06645 [Isosphaeraceae bacterium]